MKDVEQPTYTFSELLEILGMQVNEEVLKGYESVSKSIKEGANELDSVLKDNLPKKESTTHSSEMFVIYKNEKTDDLKIIVFCGGSNYQDMIVEVEDDILHVVVVNEISNDGWNKISGNLHDLVDIKIKINDSLNYEYTTSKEDGQLIINAKKLVKSNKIEIL